MFEKRLARGMRLVPSYKSDHHHQYGFPESRAVQIFGEVEHTVKRLSPKRSEIMLIGMDILDMAG